MSDDILLGVIRGLGTFGAALVALPFVAWIEGLRGNRTPGVVTGPRGALAAIATAIKLLEKRSPRTLETDRLLHAIAPVLALVPTLAVAATIPLGPHDPIAATLPFILALNVFSTAAIALAGFAGGNRLALLAALRTTALRLSVLVVVATAALASARSAGTLGLLELVAAQAKPLLGALPRFGAFVVPTAFLSALLALAIHSQHVLRARTEPTLAEPWLIEATGPVLLGHRVLETLDLLAGACLLAIVFLGGWHLPFLSMVPFELVSVVKIAVATVLIIAARNMLPPLTSAIALRVCWIVLLPFAALGVLLAFLGVP